MKVFISPVFRTSGAAVEPLTGTVVTKDVDGNVISNGEDAVDLGNGQLKYEEENNNAVIAIFTATGGSFDENDLPHAQVFFLGDSATVEVGNVLVSLADYKSFIQVTSSAYDELFSLFRKEVEGKVLSRLRRDIFSQSYEELYDGTGTNFLVLNQFPVTAVTKIEEYDGLDSDNEEVWKELIVGDDYSRKIIKDEVKLYLDGRTFCEGIQNYRITYTAGYTTVPAEIQMVCKKLFKLYYEDYQGRLGKVSDSMNASGGNANTTYDALIEEKLLKELDSYAKWNF